MDFSMYIQTAVTKLSALILIPVHYFCMFCNLEQIYRTIRGILIDLYKMDFKLVSKLN